MDRLDRTRRVAAGVLLLVAASAFTGCAGTPGTGATATPAADTTTARALPDEPRVMAEWYPDGADGKTIVMTDASLAAPAVAVVPDTAKGVNVHAAWAPDGRRFAWEVLDQDAGRSSVWIADADGSDPEEAIACEGDPCAEISWPAWAPDGESILVVQYDGGPDVWGSSHLVDVDLATGERTVIASTPDGATAFYTATWSPDAAHVAAQVETYTDDTESDRTGSDIRVFDTDPATADPGTRITPPALFAGYPDWHPTEDRILFASWDLDAYQGAEDSELYEVASDGSGLRRITHEEDGRPGEASWTPDGTRILATVGVVTGGAVSDVKVSWVDPETGEIERSDRSGAMPVLQPTP